MPIAEPNRVRPRNRVNTNRVRSAEHAKFIRKHKCAACGLPAGYGNPIEAAHVRVGHAGGLAVKPGDERLVPLHVVCHRAQHSEGETAFWAAAGVHDPVALAHRYARQSPVKEVREAVDG